MLTFDELKEKLASWAAMHDLADRVQPHETAHRVLLRGSFDGPECRRFERFCESVEVICRGAQEGLWACLPGHERVGHGWETARPAAVMRRREPTEIARHPFAEPLPTVAPRAEWVGPTQEAPQVEMAPVIADGNVVTIDLVGRGGEPVRRQPEMRIDDGQLRYAADGSPVAVGQRVVELADGPGVVTEFERDYVVVRHDNGQTMYYLPNQFTGTAELEG